METRFISGSEYVDRKSYIKARDENSQLHERIVGLQAEVERLLEVVIGWREHDWPEWFCRRTAEAIADRVRETQALIKEVRGDD